ncbi:MAG: excinuclease ABC subunit UvrA [Planctomycetes bacterium]|nr:excinuclease ABC subunit UvrA [Planctomycetota bacterium]
MTTKDILIRGAREHNLRSVDLAIPRNRLICLTGVSGSGKSSLAFDTLYAEGQRRYIESLSSFARQFIGQMPKPDVDHIDGLSPSISISQKSAGNNPRSTVGTITEIHDYLRILFARVGQAYCPNCDRPVTAQSRDQIIGRILDLPANTRIQVLAPLIRRQKGEYRDLFADLLKQGYVRARVDGRIGGLADDWNLDRQMRHDIDVVIDRLTVQTKSRSRLAEAVESAIALGEGALTVVVEDESGAARDVLYSVDYACTPCGISLGAPTPQLFSFNSPQGMCPHCDGLGRFFSFDPERLIPDDRLSMKDGCVELLGAWRDMGHWRRHQLEGVAATVDRRHGLPTQTMAATPWRDLPQTLRDLWLHGTGEMHVTFTWRDGPQPVKFGGTFAGIIPELTAKYRESASAPHRKRFEAHMRDITCPECGGARLIRQARFVRIESSRPAFAERPSRSLPDVCALSIADCAEFFNDLALDATQRRIAAEVLKEVRARLAFLLNVGLDYLTLDRSAPTLSGGESQRIRLAGQIGSGLVGVLYILDEPSIGLHPRDNDRLIATLKRLRDMGNTVVVVEHDEETMRAADHLIDFGPGPGVRGGEVVAAGPAAELMAEPRSVTGQFLAGRRTIAIPARRRAGSGQFLRILGAAHNNLDNIDVAIPLGAFVCVTGVSGSGKSSLVNDILVEALNRDLNHGSGEPGAHRAIQGLKHLDKLIAIDQSPIGRTPRSNPGTYVKVLDEIRKLFAGLPEAKRRGFDPGRFSFNVTGGRCEACEGNGSNRLEMDFLADVWVTCPVCQGRRFNRETLQVRFKDRSIADVLDMDVQQAIGLFENIPAVRHRLQTLHDVGLDYLKLGQPSPTLSGGEAQRIKLARELVKKSTGRTLYLLDEPTTGLHFADIDMLLRVLHGFVDAGNTVLVVEHNLDVVKTADWIIDLGPEGGAGGGRLIAEGTPESVSERDDSHTGRALGRLFAARGTSPARRAGRRAGKVPRRAEPHDRIRVVGAAQHNLRDVSAELARDRMTVFCGPSGSGKSSLAMDTIYAEGQRRYVESLSAYARQFVSQMRKPKVEHIEGLSPAIAIEQKNLGHTPRSTVGTVTEIHDYLRVLFARLGRPHCPACDVPVGTQTTDQIVDKILEHDEGTRLYLLAPLPTREIRDYRSIWLELRSEGYARVRVDGRTYSLDETPTVDRRSTHTIEVVVDRIAARPADRSRIAGSVEQALQLGEGTLRVAYPREDLPEPRWDVVAHSRRMACHRCGRSFEPLTPNHFSFNSPLGRCPGCEGLGTQSGANPSLLLADNNLSLRTGVLLLWPDLSRPVSNWMLDALCRGTGIHADRPFDQMSARHRRMLLHGTGDQWFDVVPEGSAEGNAAPLFRFRYKGVYPALEEASRLSPYYRRRLGMYVDQVECSACGGSRLREDAAAVRFLDLTIDELCRMPLARVHALFAEWTLTGDEQKVAGELAREVGNRLEFLIDVGLHYLTLARQANSLSNGESQRIRLASQLGSGLCGVLYVLDEPTIGLHPRDNRRLLGALHKLRDLGNTLLVVEHDREVIEGSDEVLDFGPAAGKHGGRVVAHGPPAALARSRGSVTGPYLSGRKAIEVPSNRRLKAVGAARLGRCAETPADGVERTDGGPPVSWIEVVGARHHNLRADVVRIPLAALVAVTGPSGSGKSSLVNDVLHAHLARRLHMAAVNPGACEAIRGVERINKVIQVDQQPLGNTPTSNPATYTGVFELIRLLFAQLPEAKLRGYSARRFSFNVSGGRCEACEGNGQKRIEMHFLPDVWVPCDACGGQRYNQETLAVRYHGRSISDVLNMPCAEGLDLFRDIPKIRRILRTLCDVGLDYLTLGQAAPTLSGGEAQRVKLAAELARPDTGRTLYLLDEPTTGLHFDDLRKLLDVLHRLVDLGNSVVLIEHNLDVIKSCDWVIDMGPEAGGEGGLVVAAGTPEHVAEWSRRAERDTTIAPSHTGAALRQVLERGPLKARPRFDPRAWDESLRTDIDIDDVGKNVPMPWERDGRAWHTRDRVGRDGEPCRWDGRILEAVVDRIHDLGSFSATEWNDRAVVAIAAEKKSQGWFFHALTGETWQLKMKFRTAAGTFRGPAWIESLGLGTLNQLDEIPLYGNEPRVRVQKVKGPWQEVEIRAHSWKEIDTPAFWDFLEKAVRGFVRAEQAILANPLDATPWKKLGRRWHVLRKGFPPGRRVEWPAELLEETLRFFESLTPADAFVWTHQVLVHVRRPDNGQPWATIVTKRTDAVHVHLHGPPGMVTLGRIADFGCDRAIESHAVGESARISLKSLDELRSDGFRSFVREHLAVSRTTG